MNWNDHSRDIPEGTHAFLSASKYAWLNYTDEKLRETYRNYLATLKGTELHEFASRCIKLGQKLPDEKITLNMFVNDAIEWKLRSEQALKYSEFCFGTADAIGLDEFGILRVFDLKTGTHKASMPQLEIYAALFGLEYDFLPDELNGYELRIYQNNNISIHAPLPNRILEVRNKIIRADEVLQELKEAV